MSFLRERFLLSAIVFLMVSFTLGIVAPPLAVGGALVAGFTFNAYRAGTTLQTRTSAAVNAALFMVVVMVPLVIGVWIVSIATGPPPDEDVNFLQAATDFAAHGDLAGSLALFAGGSIVIAAIGGAAAAYFHARKLEGEYLSVGEPVEPRWAKPAIYATAGSLLLIVIVVARFSGEGAWATFVTRFMGLFVEAAPFLVLGALLSGIVGAFVPPQFVARFSPRNPIAGAVVGSLLGFAFPVCECGVVPVVRRLLGKGLPLSTGVAFLLGAPVLNVIVLMSTSAAFGWGTVLWARFGLTAVIAIAVGVMFSLPGARASVLRPVSTPAPSGGATDIESRSTTAVWPGIQRSLALATSDVYSMGRLLVLGALLAAAMQTLADRQALIELGSGPVTSVWVMQALAYLLSVCSTVDAFLALALTGTFTTGSIIAFLTFGPMVDIKSTAMYLAVFRTRAVIYLILLPLMMTMLFSIWFNLNVSS